MKKAFPGYFALSIKEKDALWEKSIFSLDANVLLNLYRYSKQTRDELISLLKSLEKRLWISNQAAYEYLENRLEVISQQEKAYDSMIKSLDAIIENFKNPREHPFISTKLLDGLLKMYAEVKMELEASKKEHTDRFSNDTIQEELIVLLDGKVGPAYAGDKQREICKLGDDRYKDKIPPGYKDDIKGGSSGSSYKAYGDLIIWKQILDKASTDKVDIIYITDDRKEDWWRIVKGKTIGPRPELVQEFTGLTGQNFYMYQIDIFMEFGAKKFKRSVKEETIKEIRGFRNALSHTFEASSSFLYEDRSAYLAGKYQNQENLLAGYTASSDAAKKWLNEHAGYLSKAEDFAAYDKRMVEMAAYEKRMVEMAAYEKRMAEMVAYEKRMAEMVDYDKKKADMERLAKSLDEKLAMFRQFKKPKDE